MKTNILTLAAAIFCGSLFAAGEPQMPDGQNLPPPPPPPPPEMHYAPGKHRMPPPPDDNFFQNFPKEEQERLKKLAQEDPEAFRKEVHKYFRQKREKEIREIMDLRKRCLEEKDEARKKELTDEMRKRITEKFDLQIKMAEGQITRNEQRLQKMQEHLDEMKADLNRRKTSRDQIIDKMVGEFLDPDHEPQMRPPHRKGPQKKQ